MQTISSNLNLYIHIGAYFWILTACNAHIQCSFLAFSDSKNFIFKCCFGGLHLPMALNVLKYVLFNSCSTHDLTFLNMPSIYNPELIFSLVLRAVPASNVLFEKNTLFSAKTFKTTWNLWGCSVPNALNLRKLEVKIYSCALLLDIFALFSCNACMYLFSRISPVMTVWRIHINNMWFSMNMKNIFARCSILHTLWSILTELIFVLCCVSL